jgi:general secretion pathway protein G
MTRRTNEVNASRGGFATCAVLSIVASLFVGCGSDERRAERMHRLALEDLEAGNTDAAAERLEEILERYPSTETADRARARLKLVRGLHEAVEKYPRRRTQDAMVEIGRALEAHRASRRVYPETLDALAPAYLPDGVPEDGWGNALRYEAGPGGRGYRLVSLGADGAPGGAGEDRDVLVRNGTFVSGAES